MDKEEVVSTEEQARLAFQAHLATLGYQIEQTNPIFMMVFDLWQTGELYRMWQEEFAPVFLWNAQARALLAPYKVLVQ